MGGVKLPFAPLLGGTFMVLVLSFNPPARCQEPVLQGGVGKRDITDHAAGKVHDPSFAKALVMKRGSSLAVLITLDVVAVEEIGRLGRGFVSTVRGRLLQELGIPPEAVLINASHCHGVVRGDAAELTVQAVRQAWESLQPVTAGSGVGHEDRISENRRIKLKDGSVVDMRRAYALPPDGQVAAVGPIDPQIGILRLDRLDGQTLAVVYQFACHPIMNPPDKGSSADYPAVASRVIEQALGDGAMALFIQGCGGDINPAGYKEITSPPTAEAHGLRLGLKVVETARRIQTRPQTTLVARRENLDLPRGRDFEDRMEKLTARREALVTALKPTNLDFKAFVPLLIQQSLNPAHPTQHVQSYLQAQAVGSDDLQRLDATNRAQVQAYLQNIHIMEELTRLNTNLALLKKHHAANRAAGKDTVTVELAALRVGDFKLVTFPGELTVEVGLNIKQAFNEPHAFVAGYTNGYIYYAATREQRNNPGYAQEDCDSILAPEWQALFESRAVEMLRGL